MSAMRTIGRMKEAAAGCEDLVLLRVATGYAQWVLLPNRNKRLKPQRERPAISARPLLAAYPNPSNGPFYFTYPVAEGVEQVELRLHDASGRLIGNHRLGAKAGILELDRRDLPTGLVIAILYWDGIRVADAKVAMVK